MTKRDTHAVLMTNMEDRASKNPHEARKSNFADDKNCTSRGKRSPILVLEQKITKKKNIRRVISKKSKSIA
jgi:hypothetical protein